MPGIPHSSSIRSDFEEFLEQVLTSVGANIGSAKKDPDVLNVFKVSLAAHTSFRGFSKVSNDPLLGAASGIARRCATLVAIRQISLTRVELRRLIECVFLYIFFLDHPMEWSLFSLNPSSSGEFDRNDPLVSLASGSPALYRAFAKGILSLEEAGIGPRCFEGLSTAYSNLSQDVHAGTGAVHSSGSLALAQDKYDGRIATKLRNDVEAVLGNAVRAIACANPPLLCGLDGIDRSWFDWLIGKDDAKKIRGGAFGVTRSWKITPV